jgi:hypothetical protein
MHGTYLLAMGFGATEPTPGLIIAFVASIAIALVLDVVFRRRKRRW